MAHTSKGSVATDTDTSVAVAASQQPIQRELNGCLHNSDPCPHSALTAATRTLEATSTAVATLVCSQQRTFSETTSLSKLKLERRMDQATTNVQLNQVFEVSVSANL